MTSLAGAARPLLPSTTGFNDLVFVQTPSSNPSQPPNYQPLIAPQQVPVGEWDQIGHLWPRMVSYSVETDAIDAFMSPRLELGMQYNYTFTFEINVNDGQGRLVPIPTGWYQLQVAVIRKSGKGLRVKKLNPIERYVTSAAMFVKVTNGRNTVPVSLRFPNITDTSLKHHLFVELIPLKEDCSEGPETFRCITVNSKGLPDTTRSLLEPRPGYKPYIVEMPFIAFYPAGGKVRESVDLKPETLSFLEGMSLAKYVAKAQLTKSGDLRRKKAMSPARYAKKNRLDLLSLKDERLVKIAPLIRDILKRQSPTATFKIREDEKALYGPLCRFLLDYNAEINSRYQEPLRSQVLGHSGLADCTSSPGKYMRLSRVSHVGTPVVSDIERVKQKTLNSAQMSNYMASRSASTDSSTSFGWKFPAFIAKVMETVGVSASQGVSVSNSRAHSETGIQSLSANLDFNYVVVAIPNINSRQCLEVQALDVGFFYDKTPGATNGLYICDEKIPDATETLEIYAHVFERCKDTTMMECDKVSQSVNQMLRGENEISDFFQNVRKFVSADHQSRLEMLESANAASREDMVIVNPIEFTREHIPLYMKIIPGYYQEKFN